MTTTKNIILIILALSFSIIKINAQGDKHILTVGVTGGPIMDWNDANFYGLPNIPSCCQSFQTSFGNGIGVGTLFEREIDNERLWSVKAGFMKSSTFFRKPENVWVSVYDYDLNGNITVRDYNGEIEHKISNEYTALYGEFLFKNMIAGDWKNNRLLLNIGGFANVISDNTYEQSEKLVDPIRGTFENNQRERFVSAGDVPNYNPYRLGLSLGLSYDMKIPISDEFSIRPELGLTYRHAITPVTGTPFISDFSWNVNTLSLEFAVKFEFRSPLPDTSIKESSLNLDIRSTGISQIDQPDFAYQWDPSYVTQFSSQFGKTEIKEDELNIISNTYKSDQMYPLLNYIFFEDNSSVIPTSSGKSSYPYRQFNNRYFLLNPGIDFSEDSCKNYPNGAMDAYYHILNIIADRMKKNPSAKILLTGCISDKGIEGGLKDKVAKEGLMNGRAQAVKDYLVNNRGIDPRKIRIDPRPVDGQITIQRKTGVSAFTVDANGLPSEPSLTQYRSRKDVNEKAEQEDLDEENRRVEITLDLPEKDPNYQSLNWVMFKPVYCEDIEKKYNENDVKIAFTIKSSSVIKSYNITIDPRLNNFLDKTSENLPPVGTNKIEGHQTFNLINLDRITSWTGSGPNRFNYSLEATNVDTLREEITKTLNVYNWNFTNRRNQNIDSLNDMKYYHIRFTKFKYDKTELMDIHKKILNLYVLPKIAKSSLVEVFGTTDWTGVTSANLSLSKGRVEPFYFYLRDTSSIKPQGLTSRGLGEVGHLEQDPNGIKSLKDNLYGVSYYDNSLPEGRFYNRSVDIIIKTPVIHDKILNSYRIINTPVNFNATEKKWSNANWDDKTKKYLINYQNPNINFNKHVIDPAWLYYLNAEKISIETKDQFIKKQVMDENPFKEKE